MTNLTPPVRIARARREIARLQLEAAREDLAAIYIVDGEGGTVAAVERTLRYSVLVKEQEYEIACAECEQVEADAPSP